MGIFMQHVQPEAVSLDITLFGTHDDTGFPLQTQPGSLPYFFVFGWHAANYRCVAPEQGNRTTQRSLHGQLKWFGHTFYIALRITQIVCVCAMHNVYDVFVRIKKVNGRIVAGQQDAADHVGQKHIIGT